MEGLQDGEMPRGKFLNKSEKCGLFFVIDPVANRDIQYRVSQASSFSFWCVRSAI